MREVQRYYRTGCYAKYLFRLIDSMTFITTSDLYPDTKQRLVGVAIERIDRVRGESHKIAADIHELINEVAAYRDGLAERVTQDAMGDVGIIKKAVTCVRKKRGLHTIPAIENMRSNSGTR